MKGGDADEFIDYLMDGGASVRHKGYVYHFSGFVYHPGQHKWRVSIERLYQSPHRRHPLGREIFLPAGKSSHLDRLVRTSPVIIRQPHRCLFIHAVKKSLWRIWQIPVWQTRHITTGLPKN